jgi:hypothetical protein
MQTSATDGVSARAVATLQEATRRLAHHAANAANAVAVNVEVLRSRLERGSASADTLSGFADRAAAAAEQLSAGLSGLRPLLALLAEAAADSGELRAVPGDRDAVELRGTTSVTLDAATRAFGEGAGVALRPTANGIILKVLRPGAAHIDVTQ